jgi:hypothetical protein
MAIGMLLPYVVPILILTAAERKRTASRQAGGTVSEAVSAGRERSVTTATKSAGKDQDIYRRHRFLLDLFLIGFLAFCASLTDPLGLMSNLCGRYNNEGVLFLMVLLFVFLFVPAALCLLVLAYRMFFIWPKCVWGKGQLWVLRSLVIAGIVLCVVLVFTRVGPPRYVTFTHGFKRCVQANADLGAIRGWLNTLDPNICTGEYIDLYTGNDFKPRWPNTMAWPSALTRFDPHYVQLMKVDAGRPKVRLTWGGALGHWGVEIGPEDMPIPPTQPMRKVRSPNGDVYYEDGEYRLPLTPGAYVWHEL